MPGALMRSIYLYSSTSSAQAADHSLPRPRESSLPPLRLLSHPQPLRSTGDGALPGDARSGPWRPSPSGPGPAGVPILDWNARGGKAAPPPRRRKVRLTPFPPDGENCVRSLAPTLPTRPAPLGSCGDPGEKRLDGAKRRPTCGGAPKRPHDRTGPGQMPGALMRSIYLYSSTRRVRCS